MTSRRLYRMYAREVHKKEARGFVEIINNYDSPPTLVTLSDKGLTEKCEIDYQQMIYWIAQKLKEKKVVFDYRSTQTSQKTKDIVVPDDFSLFSRYKN